MIVEVVGGAREVPEVRVVDVDNLARLHLALGEVTDEEADQCLREAGLGRLEGPDDALLDVAALRGAAEPRATLSGWPQRWDSMVESARGKGWLTDDGTQLKVHVEGAAGA